MKINVDINNLKIIDKDQLESGEYNVTDLEFIFSPEYENLQKVAIFGCNLESEDPKYYKVILHNDKCIIPEEVLHKTGQIVIGCYAYEINGEELIKRYSPVPIKIIVEQGSFRDNFENVTPPTPSELEQIQAQINQIEAKIIIINNTLHIYDTNFQTVNEAINDINEKLDDIEGDIADTYSKQEIDDKFSEVDEALEDKVDTTVFEESQNEQDEKLLKLIQIASQLPTVSGEGTNISLSPTIEYDLEVGYKGDTKQATSILPSEYQQVEYIESTGTQYIDTEIEGEAIWNIKIQGTLTGSTQIILSRYHDVGYWFGILGSTGKYGMGASAGQYFDINGNTLQEITVEGTSSNISATIGSISCSRNISDTQYLVNSYTLFASGNSPSANRFYSSAKLYYAKCTQNNVVTFEGIPCYRISDNVIGLYDLVNDVFYTNSGTGTFTKGSNVSIPNPNYPQDIQVVTGTQEVEVVGKNLYDNSKHNNQWVSPTGIASVSGANIQKIKCIEGDIFTLSVTFESSGGNSVGVMAFYDENDTLLNRSVVANTLEGTLTRTAPANTSYMYVGHYINTPITMQVEKTNQATTYEPYQSQTYFIHLGEEELCKIGNYQDKIYYDNGKWYKTTTIPETTLTSDMCSSVTASASYGTLCYLNFNGKVDNTNICAMSNKFVGVSYDNRTSLPTGYRIFTSDGSGAVTIRFPNNSTIDTLQEVKDFVDNNVIEVRYVSQTASTTEITDTTLLQDLNNIKENAMSYSGTTNISTSGNLPIIITASALKQLS